MRTNTTTNSICYNSKVPQNGAGMYPSRDVTFNYRVSYSRVKRAIAGTELLGYPPNMEESITGKLPA